MKTSRIRQIIFIVGFLVLPALFLRARVKKQDELNVVDRFLLRLIAPVQKGFSYVAWKIRDVGSQYFSLVDVKKENEKLSQEKLELETRVHILEDAEQQKERLQKLLGFREQLKVENVAARVIQVDSFPTPNRSFTVYLAEKSEQVQVGMPVISMGAVVGKVLHRFGNYAKIQLITDPNFSLLSEVSRTSSQGILKGSKEGSLLQLSFLNKKTELLPGDRVLTPGIGNSESSMLFPPNSFIGTIEKVDNPAAGFDQKAWIVPAVDLANTREVLILLVQPLPSDPQRRPSETGERRRSR